MFKPAKEDRNVSRMIREIKKGVYDFDIPIQREKVWEPHRKNKLIMSLIQEIPIGYCIVNGHAGSDEREVIDGKQRLTTISDYINDEFALGASTKPIVPILDEDGNEIDFARRKFSDLPKFIQEIILGQNISILKFDDLTNDQMGYVFEAVNNGKSLNTVELLGASMKSNDTFRELSRLNAIDMSTTPAAKRGGHGKQIAIYTWLAIFGDSKSYQKKDLEGIKNVEVSDSQKSTITSAFDWALQALLKSDKIRPKDQLPILKKKTHLVSLAYMAYKAQSLGMPVEKYVDVALKFFVAEEGRATTSEAYNAASQKSVGRTDMVTARLSAIDEALAAA